MKSFKYIIALLIFFSFGSLSAQNIVDAFENQDFNTIKEHLTSAVSVKVGNSEKAKGSAKGMLLIKKVLTDFQPIRMESKHTGSSEDADSNYLIAKLYNANNEALRVFIHLENDGDAKRICDVKMRKS